MSEFTSVRGVKPLVTESTILVDTREAVIRERVDGVFESEVVGDLVVQVTPVGNVGKAGLFINEERVLGGFRYTTREHRKAFDKAVAKELKKRGLKARK